MPPDHPMLAEPDLEWRDGVPVAARYGDAYYQADGRAEAAHVFMDGNDLPARLAPGFRVGELGFGTGLNALVLSEAAPCPVAMTSFEAHPMGRDDMARALAPFGGGDALVDQWPAERIALPNLDLRIVFGDARETLPPWDGRADAWFLDGFAPARNPEMWGEALLAAVGRATPAGGTVATFTAAGHVRRALDAAGFDVARVPGFGRKRHMTRGTKR